MTLKMHQRFNFRSVILAMIGSGLFLWVIYFAASLTSPRFPENASVVNTYLNIIVIFLIGLGYVFSWQALHVTFTPKYFYLELRLLSKRKFFRQIPLSAIKEVLVSNNGVIQIAYGQDAGVRSISISGAGKETRRLIEEFLKEHLDRPPLIRETGALSPLDSYKES